MPPFALAALRFLFAAVPMVFFVRPPAMPWRNVVAYGFAIGVCQFGLLFLGIKLGMPAGLSSLVIQMQVFFTIGLAVAFAGDRLRRHNLVGGAIAVAGIVVLAAHKLAAVLPAPWSDSRSSSPRRSRGRSATSSPSAARAITAPTCSRSPCGRASCRRCRSPRWPSCSRAAGRVPHAVASMSLLAWGCVLVMSYGATLFGYGSWNALLHRYPTALISPFALLIPVSGLASGALFLGESLAPVQIAGVALVFAGLVVNVYGLQMRTWLARRM